MNIPAYTPNRLRGLACVALANSLVALVSLPELSVTLRFGFGLQGLAALAWLMRRAVRNPFRHR